MHWNIGVISIFLCTIIAVCGRRDAFETKCKRTCNTMYGSLGCWSETTDGFAYGLSTAMIDYCLVILNIRFLTNETVRWYNASRAILAEQIEQYSLTNDVKQLTKEDIEQIATSLLESCFNSSSPITLTEPSCPSCSEAQLKIIKQWRLSSIIIISIGALFFFITVSLYAFYNHYTNRSYTPLP
ncbi:unnamed protein product [Rotaria magnacalcarata]|uniref:Uncharacterized protein n=4 Tax=Rotaria magnacalcarata TaxID=392030 RepID=A0A816SXH7_9BILA|nr:unnamed protein product [Rotaria magnacalcarata]CAF2090528.1 unnamed protein product [Rotaria magnacalcarata]CAF3892419.1 unnamed protein product [Rotaria magnacalcarata]